jgi:hypothetical protein
MSASEDKIDLKIGRDEALVLFEMLYDFYEQPALQINGPAEKLALVRLHGALEKVLVEPFMPDYTALLEAARTRLESHYGDEEASSEPG